MNESSPPVAPPPETLDPSIPLDLKFFYGLVVVLVVGTVALIILGRPVHQPAFDAPEPPRHLEAFAFTDQTGRTVTQAEVAGKFLVVSFVHSSCSISCLQVNHHMAEVQRLTLNQDDVRLLSFTVDPRTDTPPVLADFGKKFGTDATRWSMLTGNKTELYAVIETSFLKRDPQAASLMPGGFHDVDRIAVVDRNGKVRRYFDGMKPTTPVAIVKFLEQLRTEPK